MSDHKNIGEALAAAMAELMNPPRSKTVKIPLKTGGTFSFSYADLPTIIDIVRPCLAKHGLSLLQPIANLDGHIAVNTVIIHASGERLESGPMAVCGIGGDAKDIGARITYMRRYALASMLCLAADDDEDVAHDGIDRPKPLPQKRHDAPQSAKTAPKPKDAPKPATGVSMQVTVAKDDQGQPVRKAIKDATDAELNFALHLADQTKADPKQAEWHAKADATISAIQLELDMRDGEAAISPARTGATRYAFAEKPKGSVLAGWENKQKYWCIVAEMNDAELIEAQRTLKAQVEYEEGKGKDTKWTVKEQALVETEMRQRGLRVE